MALLVSQCGYLQCGRLSGQRGRQGQGLEANLHQAGWCSPVRLKHRVRQCRVASTGFVLADTVVANLGQLSRVVDTSAEDLSWAAQRVSPESFASRGLYVDPAIVFSSGFLLLLLLALSFQRILGLDRIIAEFMLQQQDRRRQNVRDTKTMLERTWLQDGKGSEEQGKE